MSEFGVRVLARTDGKGAYEPMLLDKGKRYGMGASWSSNGNGADIDIDLQCVVVDEQGVIIDCAYYNNLKAVRAITHSGDEVAGRDSSIEEMVWINFQRLPPHVALLIFVVAAYSGGTLQDVRDGRLHVFDGSESNEAMLFEMERSHAAVDVVAAMVRRDQRDWNMQAWGYLHLVDVPAQPGKHFMDILPQLSQTIRGFLPHAPAKQKVAFAMEKGGVLDLPMDLNRIVVGLGWDVDDGECDLDVSAVLLDARGQDLGETVFFGRLVCEHHGIRHTGDNLTGEGEGDDEQIIVQLGSVGPVVQQIFFVVNIYTPRRTFQEVAAPYCRVVDDNSGAELCRYALRDAGRGNGLIVARLCREAGGRWGFHALGLPCTGRMYKDSLPKILSVASSKTADFMVRNNSSGSVQDHLSRHDLAMRPQPQSQACALL